MVEVQDEDNLVVDLARTALAHLLGGDVAQRSVTQIAFGSNGTAPASGNTLITNAYTKAVDAVTYPAAGQVAFAFSLGSAEANGLAIAEFGLLTAGGQLFARRTRAAALPKDTDLAFSGAWTLSF